MPHEGTFPLLHDNPTTTTLPRIKVMYGTGKAVASSCRLVAASQQPQSGRSLAGHGTMFPGTRHSAGSHHTNNSHGRGTNHNNLEGLTNT